MPQVLNTLATAAAARASQIARLYVIAAFTLLASFATAQQVDTTAIANAAILNLSTPAENVLAVAAYQMLFGGLAMGLAGTLHGEWSHLAFTVRTGSAVGYLLVFGSIAGFSAYGYALKHLPIATVSLYAYVNPVIAVILGTLVLDEPMSPRLAVAGLVVLVGIGMVRK